MKKTILPLCFLLLVQFLFGQQDTESRSQKLDDYLASAHAADRFNGTALVAQGGKILLNKGYGSKNAATNALNDTNTIFQIGSITKSFTAVVMLKLRGKGKLSFQDPLSKYFPDYPHGSEITIQHLLTHTSGIHNYTDDIGEEDTAIICHPVPQERVLDVFKDKPLAFKPGNKFEYCNSGYYLLGMIIEKITGKPYETVVRETIFNPLQMSHSGFDFSNLHDTNKAQGYITLTKTTTKPAYIVDSTVYFSAGAIYSTTADLYKWGKAIAAGSILQAASWQQAFTTYKNKHGYGFVVDSMFGKRYIKHDGGLIGFITTFVYYPADDVTIILLNNVSNYDSNLQPVIAGVSAITFNLPYSNWSTETPNAKLNEAQLRKLVGAYTVDGKTNITVTLEKGQLYAAGNSKQFIPKLPIYPISETKFLLKEFNVVLEFTTDKEGNINGFISHENGKDVALKRIK